MGYKKALHLQIVSADIELFFYTGGFVSLQTLSSIFLITSHLQTIPVSQAMRHEKIATSWKSLYSSNVTESHAKFIFDLYMALGFDNTCQTALWVPIHIYLLSEQVTF